MTVRRGRAHLGRPGRVAATALVVILAAAPALAQNQELKPLLDRLERLERDIRTLNLQVSRGPGTLPSPPGQGVTALTPISPDPSYARLEERLTSLEEDVRGATGRMEVANHGLDQLTKRLDKLVADIDFRLSALERGGAARAPGAIGTAPTAAPSPSGVSAAPPAAAGQGATPPQALGTISPSDLQGVKPPAGGAQGAPAGAAPATPPAESGALPKGSASDQYAYAFGLLRQARYDEAETALRAFIKAYGNDPLAANARYWLGETYYVRGDYVQAAEVFLEGYQSAPKGQKAPDALLKLGMSLGSLDKKKEACATFAKLLGEFGDAPASKVAVRERQRYECK